MLKPFVVVIPSFNNARWCQQNLESVLTQDYPLFRVLYIDDASTDDTAELVTEYLLTSPYGDRVTFERNESRQGATANIDRAVRSCDPDEIVVLVDGDDFLAHPQVLERLNAIYQDPDVWVTWGQFIRFPDEGEGFCTAIPSDFVSANAYRDYPFVSSHLRTFYAGLYQRIRLLDVKDSEGRFFTTAGDVAQMFALLEMAGPRARFLAEILYRYNRANPLNDDKLDRAAQLRAEREIRSKARYGRLASRQGTTPPREICFATGVGRTLFEVTGVVPDIDERRRPFRQLRTVLNRLGYTVRETQTLADVEDPHRILVFDVRPDELEKLSRYPSDALTLVLWNDPVWAPHNLDARYHRPFGQIYTWCDDQVDGERYLKLHHPFLRPMIDDVVPFESRRLCALVASPQRVTGHSDALYAEEWKVAQFFAEAEGDSFDVSTSSGPERLRRYRFSFCYETVRGANGYVTAKIFDSMAAGCVPIYLGSPTVSQSIPRDCFIARDEFDSYADLHAFLRDMPKAVYDGYLERIRSYLSSALAVPHSAEHFVRTFVALIGGRAAPSAGRRPERPAHPPGGGGARIAGVAT